MRNTKHIILVNSHQSSYEQCRVSTSDRLKPHDTNSNISALVHWFFTSQWHFVPVTSMYTWSVPIDNFVLVLQIGLHCFLRNKWLPAYQTSQNIQSLGHSLTPTLCIFFQDMYDGKCQKSWTSAFVDVLEGTDQLLVQHMATANRAKAKVGDVKTASWVHGRTDSVTGHLLHCTMIKF